MILNLPLSTILVVSIVVAAITWFVRQFILFLRTSPCPAQYGDHGRSLIQISI